MNTCLAAAAVVAFAVGLAHSVIGEWMIFRKLRGPGHVLPRQGGGVLDMGKLRILWASWHVLTVMGWGFAALLAWASLSAARVAGSAEGLLISAWVMALSALIVLVATNGRHPGWVGLAAVAVLIVLR